MLPVRLRSLEIRSSIHTAEKKGKERIRQKEKRRIVSGSAIEKLKWTEG